MKELTFDLFERLSDAEVRPRRRLVEAHRCRNCGATDGEHPLWCPNRRQEQREGTDHLSQSRMVR